MKDHAKKLGMSNEVWRDQMLRYKAIHEEGLFNIKYDRGELGDLLEDTQFIESYNNTSRRNGREM